MSLFIHRKYSTKGIPRLSSADRALVTIPNDIRDILVGILLGDSLVRKIVSVSSIFLVLFASYIDLYYYTTLDLYYCSTLVLPILTYSNPKSDKFSIFSENKGKSGIYLWKNKNNGKKYVGSSVDLSKRLRN